MEVREGELMICNEWIYEWEERTGERRQRGGVFYSPLKQTSHVSSPAQLSKSLLWLNILSIRSGTCVLMRCYGGVESFQFHTLLHLLLN